MALHKIKDFDADYKTHFDNDDVIGFDLYSGTEKVGSVDDILVDDNGAFRYFVVHTGVWILGKTVLLPVAQGRIVYSERKVYASNLTKTQVENLPEYSADQVVDYDHEEKVRGVYRPAMTAPAMSYDRDSYSYDREPDLYALNDDHQNLRLYQERLVASKTRQKTGEVAVGKHIETETANVSVPIEKERVVIERTPVTGSMPVTPGTVDFHEGEVARVEVYEEVADIQKEAFVREEVRVTKVVDRETVTAEEQVRREELDLDVSGNPNVDKKI
ncbi:MAG TPA: DUF2382 domain-containing protein [Leptolyngbya sp.]|jgi:uncharacterized protein (TIGR02271 family)|nr:DUF2382 domain-containing protein [Leptolyngbya sp.]